jgi:ABC-type lipoprotein export system ATPase subunit
MMLTISDLEFWYERESFQLRLKRFTMQRGERAALIGPSGSGKTTLLHLMAGILVPKTGAIRVGESNITALNDVARREYRLANIGMVFQEFELIEYMTVLDNILLPYRLTDSQILTREVRGRAAELAERVGLADKLQRRPAKLSHGERQRVAICRGLISEPKMILADEPTGNLDPENKHRIVKLLRDYAEEHQVAMLMVTHDHSLLGDFDRVINFSDLTLGGDETEHAPAEANQRTTSELRQSGDGNE